MLSVSVLVVLAVGLGRAVARSSTGSAVAGAAAAYAALVVVARRVVRLPVSFWRDHLRERRYGFSTQARAAGSPTPSRARRSGSVLTAAVLGRARRQSPAGCRRPGRRSRRLRSRSPSASSPSSRPSCSSRLFNRFQPLADERARARSCAGSPSARGVPVRDVLVADASRRTTKVNAYVSGLGKTRRVVLYDTLLDAADEGELKLVVAHELGHRRERHVVEAHARGDGCRRDLDRAALGGCSARGSRRRASCRSCCSSRSACVPSWPLPVAALSRRWERVADRYSLELTRDLRVVRAHAPDARAARTSATSRRRGSRTCSSSRTRRLRSASRSAAPGRLRSARARARPLARSRPPSARASRSS